MIKLTVEGIDYEFDGDRLLLAEARELKTHTGLTPGKWGVGIDEGDPDAIAFLIYLAKKRSGESLRFSDLDNIDYADIQMEEIGAAGDDAAGDAAAADPTPQPVPQSSGPTPSDGTGATSPLSPTDSSTTLTTSAV